MKAGTMMEIFQETGAILEGHFLLSSGLHSPHYVQCARIFEDPILAESVVRKLAEPFAGVEAGLVVGPALGGILLAYELARSLKIRAAFTERVEGRMTLRRGFAVAPGSRIIVAEDVLTTGGSVLEAAEVLLKQGGEIRGVAALVNRSNVQLPYPSHALLSLNLVTYKPEDCPLCQKGKPIDKPGSRVSKS